jgi:excinuclease ABC subunit C
VYRRYKRLRDEGASLPQLVVIDGGKGQLSHALEALDELGLRGQIAMIGIAKRLEELYFPGDSLPIYLDKRSPTLRVIQHMRNEAHRFSLAHHRSRRSKAFLTSELDDIPGVGPKTRDALMTAFGDVQTVSQASLDDLLKVVNLKVAQAVRVHFHGSEA